MSLQDKDSFFEYVYRAGVRAELSNYLFELGLHAATISAQRRIRQSRHDSNLISALDSLHSERRRKRFRDSQLEIKNFPFHKTDL